jgi:hypothetical protein
MPTGLGGERLWLCPTLDSTELLDLSGNGSHATYYGGMGTVVDKRNGGTLAYRFENNLSKYIQVSNKENLDFIIRTNRFSISLWVYTPTGVNTTQRAYLGCGLGANDYGFGLVEFNSQGYKTRLTKQTVISPQAYSPDTRSTTAIPEEAWSHIAATVSDNEAKIYLNGVEVASQAGPFRTTNTGLTSPLVIGKYTYNNGGSSGGPFAGWQDDIRIYNRTLSETEITHLASKRGVLGSPHSPIKLKSHITKLVSDRDDSIKPNLLSINKPKRSEPSYKSGYAKSASESASPHLWDGLVGAWMPSLGATGGTLRDVSGNDNHGTLNGMDAASDWVATSKGLALDFDGVDDYARCLDANNAADFDVKNGCSFFVEFTADNVSGGTSFSSSNPRYFIAKSDDNHVTRSNYLVRLLGQRIEFTYCNAFQSYNGFYTTDPLVNVGERYFAGVMHDGTSVRMFINGREVSVTTYAGSATNNSLTGKADIWFGSQFASQRFFDGRIHSTSIYNRALSPQEIQELYVDSLAPFRQKSIRIFGGVGIPTDTSKIITVKRSKHVEPSYKSGYAQSAGESAHPNLWDGLVGAWMPSMGVTGKTLRDVSGNDNHGTLTYMDAASDWVATSKGLALDFDGSNDYVTFGNVLNLSEITVSTWFKPDALIGRQFLIGKWEDGKRAYQIAFNPNGFPSGTISSSITTDGQLATHVECDVQNSITSTSEWYHVCMTADGNELSTYVDGKVGNVKSAGSPYTAGNAYLSLGTILFFSNTSPLNPANACISNTSIYNRALTPDEIQTLYVDSLAPFRKKQQVAFNAYPLTLLQKIRSAAKPTQINSIKLKEKKIKPSYKNGYARNAAESINPELWNGLIGAWVPNLGVTGSSKIKNLVSKENDEGELINNIEWSQKGMIQNDADQYVLLNTGYVTNQGTVIGSIDPLGRPYTTYRSHQIWNSRNWSVAIGGNNYTRISTSKWDNIGGYKGVGTANLSTEERKRPYCVASSFKDGDAIKLYVDGDLIGETPYYSSQTQVGYNTNIFSYSDKVPSQHNWYGPYLYGPVLLYNRVLNAAEIKKLSQDLLAPFIPKGIILGSHPPKELRGLFRT